MNSIPPIDKPHPQEIASLQPPLKAVQNRVYPAVPAGPGTIAKYTDAPDPNSRRWFLPESTGRPIRTDNEVTPFLKALDVWCDIGSAIAKCSDPLQHFVYFVAWDSSVTTPMSQDRKETLGTRLSAISGKVAVRAMLWKKYKAGQNQETVEFVRSLGNGWAIWDDRTRTIDGSHHQKFMVINNTDGLVAYCGGIDLEAGREHWNDAQCRVRGKAAEDILATFVERWTDHPDTKRITMPVPGLIPYLSSQISGPATSIQAQVVRTYGNLSHLGTSGTLLSLATSSGFARPYAYAPNGEHNVYDQILNAVQISKQFIYVQDQYLVECERMANLAALSDVLRSKLKEPNFKYFVALIARSEALDLYQQWARREKFIRQIWEHATGKVFVCQYKITNPDIVNTTSPTYVHSKTWVFDDQFAIIGSANSNRRSYTNDSELNIGFADANTRGSNVNAVHRFRMNQWITAHNEGRSTERLLTDTDVLDFERAINLWKNPDPAGPIETYYFSPSNSTAKDKNLDRSIPLGQLSPSLAKHPGPLGDLNLQWNIVIDPDGE